MTKCVHGIEITRDTSDPENTYEGQMSTCACCGTIFPYIDEYMSSEYEELEPVWEPKDRCEKCGGRYVRRHFGSVE
jgi:rRNA maturation endonuclease Nob1